MGTRGTKYDSDIALDDISISPGPCVRNKPKVAESLTSDDSVLSDEKGHKVHGGVTDKHAKSSKGNSNKNDKGKNNNKKDMGLIKRVSNNHV